MVIHLEKTLLASFENSLNAVPVSDNKIALPFRVDELHVVDVAIIDKLLVPAIFILLVSWRAASARSSTCLVG